MASAAQFLPASNRPLAWFLEWLRDELTPYPGRTLLVVRMVLAATLIMLIGMTFQIPYTWQGAIYALLVSRESPRATLKSAATICFVTGIGAAYIVLSMKLAINILPLHFLWIVATLFFVFYGISTLTNYLVAVALVNTISAGIPLWDRHLPAEANVEDTLWLCLAVLIAVAVTAGVELVFVRQPPGDEVVLLINDRLSAVENLLACYAQGRAADPGIDQKIIQLEMLGTSLLRRTLRRSDYLPRYSTEMAALAALVGRLVDLAATLTQLGILPSASNQSRFQRLASAVASISNSLTRREVPTAVQFNADKESAAHVPLLGEMERTVTMMSEVLTGSRSVAEYLPSPDDLPQSTLLSRDAFVNHDHLRFALKGCLAASSCYVTYNALAWPGISTAVTTCLLTALSTIGASHQKQILRIAGAIVGGFVLGMGSQMFILPYLDSIAGFLFLFVLVTALSSWFLTSSPRLSYFGVQVALAFYLTTLQELKIQTSLAVARDRVVGILLGLFMMWLVFDRLWGAPASIEMKRTFISNLRAMAHFVREPASNNPRIAIARTLTLRDTINANLDRTRALADGILFEFGPSRRRDLKLRSQIRRWQPKLRTLFVMRITSLKYRLQLPGFEWSETVRRRQQAYDEQSAQMLEKMADCIEGDRPAIACGSDESTELLKWTIEETLAEESRGLLDGQAQSFITLMRGIDGLTSALALDIAAELGSPAEGC